MTFLSLPALAGQQYYRFKDADGVVVLKDYLPPEVTAQGYDIVNDHGQILERVPPAKTREELREEERQRKLAEQEALEAKERARRDTDLLRQYSNVEDLTRNRDTQLGAIQQRIEIYRSQNELLKIQLADLQQEAANQERRAQSVDPKLNRQIDDTQRQLANNESQIQSLEIEQKQLYNIFTQDIVRFKHLHAKRLLRKRELGLEKEEQAGIFECEDNRICDKAWKLSQIFARDKSDGRLEIITDTLILTRKPQTDSQFALSFSRVPDKGNRSQIVLEVECSQSKEGQQLCRSEKVNDITKSFVEFLNKRLDTI